MEKLPSESLSGPRLRWNFTPCILNTEEANGFSAETLPGCHACPCAVSRCPSWWVLCCQRPAYPAARPPPRVSRMPEKMRCLSVCLSLKLAPLRSAHGMAKRGRPHCGSSYRPGRVGSSPPSPAPPPVQGNCPFRVEQVDRSGPRRGRG